MSGFRKGRTAKVNKFASQTYYADSAIKQKERRKNVGLLFVRMESHDMRKWKVTIMDGFGAIYFKAVDYLTPESALFEAEQNLKRLRAMTPESRDRLLVSGDYPPVNQ